MNSYLEAFDRTIDRLSQPGEIFEVDEVDISGTNYRNFALIPSNLGEYFKYLLGHGEKDFLVYGDQRYSFNYTYQLAASLATSLKEDFAVNPGDRVAIFSRNNPEWIISFIAIACAGGVSVPLNAWWTDEELDYGIADSGSVVLLVDGEREDLAIPVAERNGVKIVSIDDKSNGRLENSVPQLMFSRPNATMPDVNPLPDDPATIFYTSGSTGKPKGALSSHRGVLSALMSWMMMGSATKKVLNDFDENVEAKYPPAALLALPLFHVAGSHSSFLLSVIVGRKIVIMRQWDPVEALKIIEAERITTFNGVPTMSAELQEEAMKSTRDFSSLAEIYAGGAARPPAQVGKIAGTFQNASPGIGYGLTETNGLGALNSGQFYIAKPGSTGRTVPPVTDIKVIDEAGEAVAAGESGEILIKSPANVIGYWNKPDATSKAFIKGWFYTGDIGYLDEDGFLFVVDRKKDIIIRGGENISCIEVESAFYSYSGIKEVSVFGLSDNRLGEVVAAVVHLNDKVSLDEEDLRAHLSKQLAAFKVPKYIFQRENSLPRVGSQKIAKRQLRAEYEKLIFEGIIKENQ